MIAPDPRCPELPHVGLGRDKTRAEELDAEASAFLERHPEFWRLFVRFVREAHGAGKTQIGAKLICERIRWEHVLAPDTLGDFDVNNSHVASVARIFQATYPELAGMFATRVRGSERKRSKDREVLPTASATGGV